jgi:hypothetical protein
MHKTNLNVMPGEEAQATTPCAEDPELWFPDEQKPSPTAVAACWSCHFQSGCARRALSNPMPEHGIWGGYRLAPGPALEVTRAQLEIVAGNAMGPAMSPSSAVSARLADLADLPAQPVEFYQRGTVDWWSRRDQRRGAAAAATAQFAEFVTASGDSAVVDLDDWRDREPSNADLADADAELATLEFPVAEDFLTDGRGQILLPWDGGDDIPPAPATRRRPVLTGCTPADKRRAS